MDGVRVYVICTMVMVITGQVDNVKNVLKIMKLFQLQRLVFHVLPELPASMTLFLPRSNMEKDAENWKQKKL